MTKRRHIPYQETVDAVIRLREDNGNPPWRAMPGILNTAAHANFADVTFEPSFFGSLHGMVNGKPGAVSPEVEDNIRRALGLDPVNQFRYACPTCGRYHTLTLTGEPVDCHGKPVFVRPTKGKRDTHSPSYRPRLNPKWRKLGQERIEAILSQHEETEENE